MIHHTLRIDFLYGSYGNDRIHALLSQHVPLHDNQTVGIQDELQWRHVSNEIQDGIMHGKGTVEPTGHSNDGTLRLTR